MGNYPCSCGGENSNCFRCYGTGLVGSRALPLRSDGRIHPKIKSAEIQIQPSTSKNALVVVKPSTIKKAPVVVKPSSDKGYTCPKCKEYFLDPGQFIHHARTFHPKPKVKVIKPKKRKENEQQLVEVKTTKDKVSNTPPTLDEMRQNQRLLEETRHTLKQLRRLYPHALYCDSCLEIFKTAGELKVHQENMHLPKHEKSIIIFKKRKLTRPEKQANTSKQHNAGKAINRHELMNNSLKPKTHINETIKNSPERRMDATYGMGSFARDHGQFGSSPSYDGMDDESSP
jgi:hypothetical protein